MSDSVTPWTVADQAPLSSTISWSLFKFMCTESVRPSNQLVLFHPLLRNRKGEHQVCILSSCLFNLYAEYIIRNAVLEETQAGIKIAGWNINNHKYTVHTTLMAESEEELKSPLMKVKVESEKVGLKLNIQKTKIMASGPIFMANRWVSNGNWETLFSWVPKPLQRL